MNLAERNLNLDAELSREDKMMMLYALKDSIGVQRELLTKMAARPTEDRDDVLLAIVSGLVADIFAKAAVIDRMLPTRDGSKYFNIKFPAEVTARIQAKIDEYHAPELAVLEGHVTQVWSDGEITDQKAGGLLWQRSLHRMAAGIPGLTDEQTGLVWPLRTHGGNGYIFCKSRFANEIRGLIFQTVVKQLSV